MSSISCLLTHAVGLKAGTDLHARLMRVLPFLTYADPAKMSLVVGHFDDVVAFDAFDANAATEESEGSSDEGAAAKMKAFVALCAGVERNVIGNTMKDRMLELGIVDKCIKYIKVWCQTVIPV